MYFHDLNCFHRFIPLCVFTDFISGFIHVLIKDLEHIHSSCFEVLVLCFSYIAVLWDYCSRIAVSWWRHSVLCSNDFVFLGVDCSLVCDECFLLLDFFLDFMKIWWL